MTTTTTTPTTRGKPRPTCPACHGTGIVKEERPKLIGHDSAGNPVYSAHKALAQFFCDCASGKRQQRSVS